MLPNCSLFRLWMLVGCILVIFFSVLFPHVISKLHILEDYCKTDLSLKPPNICSASKWKGCVFLDLLICLFHKHPVLNVLQLWWNLRILPTHTSTPESESCSVLSNSLWSHGLYCPWNSPGQNTGVGSLPLLQGIFPTQGSNPGFPHCRWILYQLSHKGSPFQINVINNYS